MLRPLVLLLVASAAAAEPAAVKTIVVVRHAEADDSAPGNDPPLSAKGQARAAELARVLGDTSVRALFCTPTTRSRATAEPLAQRAGDKLTVVDEVPATLAAIRAEPWGTTAVVVGHSNTVPKLVEGLSGAPFPAKEKVGFDGMWIVTVPRDGTASVLRLHYGAPTP